MQRIRIGLTGLAFVFVLVMLGAVFSTASDEPPITAKSVQPRAGAALPPADDADPTEPLAELGVAPGNADANATDAAGAVPTSDR